MDFKSLIEKFNLEFSFDEENVFLGYFKHIITLDSQTVEVITFSKDFSLYLSNMKPEVRRGFTLFLVQAVEERGNILYFSHKHGSRYLCSLVDSGTKKILHIDKGG